MRRVVPSVVSYYRCFVRFGTKFVLRDIQNNLKNQELTKFVFRSFKKKYYRVNTVKKIMHMTWDKK